MTERNDILRLRARIAELENKVEELGQVWELTGTGYFKDDGIKGFWSNELLAIAGYHRGEVDERFYTFLDTVVHPEDLKYVDRQHALLVPDVNRILNYRIIDKNKNILHVQEKVRLTISDDNRKMLTGTIHDISAFFTIDASPKENPTSYHALINGANDRIALLKEDQTKVLVNTAYYQSLRYSELQQSKLLERNLVLPDDKKIYDNAFQTALQSGSSVAEYRIHDQVGQNHFMDTRFTRIWSDNGKTPYVLQISRDITQLKEAEIRQTESESKFRRLFEVSNDAILLLKESGEIVDCNRKTAALFETSRSELIGHFPWELSPERQPNGKPSKEKAITIFNEALSGEKPIFHWQHLSRKGYLFDAEIQLSSIQVNNQQLLLVNLRDTTRQSLVENALRESEQKFRKFFDNSLLGNIITLADHSFAEVNEKACSILGYAQSELKVMNWTQIVHQEDHSAMLPEIEQIFQGRKNEITREIRLERKNGHLLFGLVAIAPLKNDAGKVYAILTSLLDITDRKLAENALKQSQQRLSSIFENAPLGIIILDGNGKLFMWNERFVSILNARGERIDMDYIARHMQPDDVNDTREALKKLVVGRTDSLVMTKAYRLNHEETLWLKVTASSIKDDDSRVQYIVCMIEDITTQTSISDSLKASERRFRSLFSHMRNGFMIIDVIKDDDAHIRNFQFVEVNEAIEEVTGFPRNQYAGKLASVLMGRQARYWFPYLDEILINQAVIQEEFFIKDTGRYLEITAYPLQGNQIAAILEDVSERKMTETSLMVNEQKFRSLAENNQDAIIRYDSHKWVTYLNRQAEELFQLRLIDIMSQPLPEKVWKKSQRKKWDETLGYVLKSGESKHIETHHKRKGKQVIMLWRLTPEFSTNNKIISVLAVSRDVTLMKEAQQQLLFAKEKAEESDKLKSAFLANMSHEIRTPLNGIMGFAELLKLSNIGEDEKQDFLENITQSGYKLLNIINDILDLSKIEAGQINIVRNRFSVNRMLNDLYKLFQPKLNLSKSKVNMAVTAALKDQESFIFSDEGRLRQIIINLVDNALKFTEEGEIEFGYEISDHTTIRFFVKDSGIGIPEDKRQAIFERFRQAQDTHLNKYGGTGLGLSIAKGFAELLGGTIDFTSEVGKGTTFYLTLPFPAGSGFTDENTSPDELAFDPEMYDWTGKKILLIDDDRSNFFLLRRLLKETGCQVDLAQNASEGIKSLKKNNYSTILMDIRLPDINGFDLTKKLRKEQNNIPIIFQTANVMEEDRKKAFDVGADDFLSKPLDFEDLFHVLEKFLK
ncbi:hypothetical protein PbJCM13498_36800 [Prolixibacter bellariivorans]|uniref:histidine kinase n=1 Tax=Prolixibacter bellariivorans TaxID=314319 RepID=A0A5M4B538_9BACT|nr:PAS domain S-box protein [Prolixibacter bellariivorans]GET34817.1 hypothetical protein PbJCM13498_36800 [Prolixibacter bellariivorans]